MTLGSFILFEFAGRLLDPRKTSMIAQTYLEESLMGVAAKCYRAICFGPHRKTIQRTFLHKYSVALDLAFNSQAWN